MNQTIKIPVKFKDVDVDKLTPEDVNVLLEQNIEIVKLQSYLFSKSYSKEEIISILSIKISCDEKN